MGFSQFLINLTNLTGVYSSPDEINPFFIGKTVPIPNAFGDRYTGSGKRHPVQLCELRFGTKKQNPALSRRVI